jgi:FHA domain-containing protein/uncharacterized protein DUF1707
MAPDYPASRPRPSITERERVARRLRGACADERLSLDTFSARLDLVYSSCNQGELRALVADLPEPNPLSRFVLAATAWVSAWTWRLSDAWNRPRIPSLALPEREAVVLGRARDCDCVLSDSTVSRRHALLTCREGGWRIRDLASFNGTYVNGARVIDEVEVEPGDDVWFGSERFRLAPPKATRSQTARRLSQQVVA